MQQSKVCNGKQFSQQLRPAWTPVNIALMVFFFATGLWFLGLAMIAYMLYGREVGIDMSNWGSAKRSVNDAFGDFGTGGGSKTGNSAFDEWRQAELKRLDEERKRLDESRKEFDDYVKELRRAQDREEFEAFRRNRSSQTSDGDAHTA